MLKFSRGLIAFAVLLTSSAARAHPGQHDVLSWQQLAEHLVSSPYHLTGWVILGVLITALVVWRVNQRS